MLVVDDEPVVRDVIKAVLAARGWSVSTATGGRDALRIMSEQAAFDVVLLDLSMPGLNGSETLSELQRSDSSTRVVLMSGFDEASALGGEAPRAHVFLQKPFTSAKLVSAIEAAMSKA